MHERATPQVFKMLQRAAASGQHQHHVEAHMPHHDFRTALSPLQPARPANDNAPITADSFTSLAARRAFVQREQTRPDPVLALPTLERLGRVAPDLVPLWKFWRDLQSTPAPTIYAPPETVADQAIAGTLRPGVDLLGEDGEPANTGFSEGGEQDLQVRPTIAEIDRAMEGAGRVAVVCTVRNGQRSDVRQVHRPCERGPNARIGDLVFRSGRLVRWGRTARGVALKPIERLRAPRGNRQKPARDLRWLVRTDAPIVKNAGFLAGMVHSTGRSGAPLECFAEQEVERRAADQSLRALLGLHAAILDLAIGDATAREIGESRGYRGKHAERRGIFLINEAFAALRALVGAEVGKAA